MGQETNQKTKDAGEPDMAASTEPRDRSAAGAAVGESIDLDEVAKFTAMADTWWDPNGKFRPLHQINPLRLEYLSLDLCAHFGRDHRDLEPLRGLRLLDVGCGGGLVCEPLARLGAQVTGIDAAAANIPIAKIHAEQSGLDINYLNATVEDLAAQDLVFDAVLALEVIEHVNEPAAFVKDLRRVMADDGLMVLSTLNKTLKSFALGIVAAEYVLRWLPKGTHEWRRFVAPRLLEQWAEEQAGLFMTKTRGLSYNPLKDRWALTQDLSCNYLATFKGQDSAVRAVS